MRLDALAAALPAEDGPLIVCLQAGNVNTGCVRPDRPGHRSRSATRHPGRLDPRRRGLRPVGGRKPGLPPSPRRPRRRRLLGDRRPQVAQRAVRLRLRLRPRSGAPTPPPCRRWARTTSSTVPPSGTSSAGCRSTRAAPVGFATYAALRSLGRDGVGEMVERCCRLATRMADGLRGGGRRVEVLNDVVLDQILVRFHAARRRRRRCDGLARSSRASRPTGRAGCRARRGTAWRRCGSRSSTGPRPRTTSTARWPRSSRRPARSARASLASRAARSEGRLERVGTPVGDGGVRGERDLEDVAGVLGRQDGLGLAAQARRRSGAPRPRRPRTRPSGPRCRAASPPGACGPSSSTYRLTGSSSS